LVNLQQGQLHGEDIDPVLLDPGILLIVDASYPRNDEGTFSGEAAGSYGREVSQGYNLNQDTPTKELTYYETTPVFNSWNSTTSSWNFRSPKVRNHGFARTPLASRRQSGESRPPGHQLSQWPSPIPRRIIQTSRPLFSELGLSQPWIWSGSANEFFGGDEYCYIWPSHRDVRHYYWKLYNDGRNSE